MLFKDDKMARSQHDAIRDSCGWYRWTHDLVEVSGEGSVEFLDRLCVRGITGTEMGSSVYTTLLDDNGGIIDDVMVIRLDEDRFWVSTLYGPQLIKWMDAHCPQDQDLCYLDNTADVDMYAIQGPNSPAFLKELVGTDLQDMQHFRIVNAQVAGKEVKVHSGGFSGEKGYEIFCSTADTALVRQAIEAVGKTLGAVELTVLEVYVRSLPMEKGLALRQDMYGLSPYEAGLGWSVDADKDFIGKAAVLKAKADGPRRKLVGIEFEDDPYEDIQQCERIYSRGVDVGFVRALAYGYSVNKLIGFAVVDTTKVDIGSDVKVGPQRTPAKITSRKWL